MVMEHVSGGSLGHWLDSEKQVCGYLDVRAFMYAWLCWLCVGVWQTCVHVRRLRL